MSNRGIYEKFFKRLIDILFSILGLIMLWPLMTFVAILVRIKLGSPVIFKQQRPGKHEKIFLMYKFRTMTDQRDEEGNLLSDDIRLTQFGKILRSTSL
ncbi:TPA: sugar transferase, partial [Enterococcus faecium]